MRFRDQAARFGAEFLTEKVTAVDFSERPFQVWVGDDELHRPTPSSSSTGAQSLMLGLEAESRLIGHGLSTCATCDGFFFRGQEIAVVGGGDSALEEAHLPHQVRRQGHARSTAATRCGPRRSCRTGPSPTRRSSSCGTHVVVDLVGDDQARGRRRCANVKTGEDVDARRSPACSSPSATGPTPTCSRACSTWTTTATSSPSPARRPPTSTACSPAATCRTTPTARPSPPPARAAWPPSTPSAGSRPTAPRLTPADSADASGRRGMPQPRRPVAHRYASTSRPKGTHRMADGIVTLTTSTFDETVSGVDRRPSSSTSGPSGAGRAR